MTPTRISFVTATLAALLMAAGCSSSGSTSSTPTAPASTPPTSAASSAGAPAAKAKTVITIKGFAYSGAMTVKPGQTVTVVNDDSAAHTLTSKADKAFDTGNLAGGGGKGTFTAPAKAGSYAFGCTYHPNMSGTLIVKN